MQHDTPLDAGLDYEGPAARPSEPHDDDRQAGEWMEGYWTEMAPWAKRFSFAVWGVAALLIYARGGMLYRLYPDELLYQVGALLSTTLLYSPLIALGYFVFDFSRQLSLALQQTDQAALGRAYLSLHRAVLIGTLVAVLMALTFLYRIYFYYWSPLAPSDPF